MKAYLNETSYPGMNALARSILFGIVFMLLLYLGGSFLVPFFPPKGERFVYGIWGTIAACLATWIFLKTEKRSFADIGLVWERATLYRFFKGILIGSVIFGLIIIILVSFTELRLERNANTISLRDAIWYLAIIPLALMEEIAFRSYPFLKLNKVFGLRLTQVIIAIAFAVYHIIGGWDPKIAFLGPGIWAFVFGLSAIWSGGIAVPTGIHVALNIILPLIGMKSGDYKSLWTFSYKEGTPENLVTRADNIGLIIQVLVLLCAIVLTEYYIRKRHGIGYRKDKP